MQCVIVPSIESHPTARHSTVCHYWPKHELSFRPNTFSLPLLPSVVPSYGRRSSAFRRTAVQLYESIKTQNGHNFGHGHARDLYFTVLEMGKKVFLVKFFWHRWDSNPRPVLEINLGPGC